MNNIDPIEKKKDKQPIIETSKIQLYDDVLYEQIYDPKLKTCYFCRYEPTTKETIIEPSIENNGIKYLPIIDQKENERPLETMAVLLPSGIEPYTDIPTLEKEINDFFYRWVDVSKEHRQKATWYTMLTWVCDNINTIPYLRALGDYGTGKTRYEDAIGGLCYKPMFVGGAVRTPPIYRIITRWRGTAIFDEFTLNKSDETEDIIKILNNGYQRGKPVIRCSGDNYEQVKYFDPFGPKVISSRKPFYDQALESRCITEIMKETGRTDIPIDLTRAFYEERLTLRNKLLLYRFNTWNKIDPDQTIHIDFGHIQPRIKQSFLPFTVLFQHDPKVLEHFIQDVKEYNNQLIDDNSSSLDGCIVNCYLEQLEYTGNINITGLDIR
ncbi:MAG: hypothetical protein KKC68_04355, partial [Candidatus Thermoplasmatota archaeon]|nr:hypothetical protein [Candidatus Thermoplasmatota archaeon]MBU1940983.1 hypothetical protein [Candidatus Thermoplasmatota archaeon]